MHKDELLQLHSLLCQMKRYFEEAGMDLQEAFGDYDELDVSPQHIHKSKTDHKRAVFLLGKGFSDLVLTGDPEHRNRLRDRFSKLAAQRKELPTAQEPARIQQRTDHLPPFALAALGTS